MNLRGESSSLLADLRYSSRLLLNAPGFILIIVCSLAIGIGASSVLFSLVNAAEMTKSGSKTRIHPFHRPSVVFRQSAII